ncbi:uncharacterized protein LOC108733326 [Agrilus planipennis]|uniref:Uncharacterized protein LOC108733326 n=1 Tax=Agrilus planipennis TaxID=224129 RepID=A0A1W4WIJ6_AGRPL|nr:uncharacterized protein LOC108733326 [Agrilus planipennis]
MGLYCNGSRTMLLWLSGFQMVLHTVVTIEFIIIDVQERSCTDDCFMGTLYIEILEFLHVIPFVLAVLLFIGILRNDLQLLRLWLIVIMGATIIILAIQIGILVSYIDKGINYKIWCAYVPLFAEMIVLPIVIAYVFQYYKIQRKPTIEFSHQDNESNVIQIDKSASDKQ